VLTTGALQRLVHGTGARAGSRAVVVGAEHVSFSAVHTLRATGTEVAAMVTPLPRHQTYAPLRWAAGGVRPVRVLTGSHLTRVVGHRRVEAVEVEGEGGETERIACDTVVFTGDWIPDHELARMGGLALDAGTRGPEVDAQFRTSVPGVFAAGNLLHGAETADQAAREGLACARAVAAWLADPEPRWRDGGVRVAAAAPLRFVVPSVILPGAPPPPVFLARADAFLGRGAYEVRQDRRVLHRERFRALVPNRSLRLSSAWIAHVRAEAGPIEVTAVENQNHD
jgi:hypothetical protein